jgi:hypothetical protein
MKSIRDRDIAKENQKQIKKESPSVTHQKTCNHINGCLLDMPTDIFVCISGFLGDVDTLALYVTNKITQSITPLDEIHWPHHVVFLDEGKLASRFTKLTNKIHIITRVDGYVNKLRKLNMLTQMSFRWSFNQPISKGVLPPSLTQLTFGTHFNQPIADGVLPGRLTQLTFDYGFNQPIAVGVLPGSLIQLTFGLSFNQPITEGVLPSSLTQLTFGIHFNQPITEGVLPASLTHLTFGRDFNQTISGGILPDSLIQLTMNN